MSGTHIGGVLIRSYVLIRRLLGLFFVLCFGACGRKRVIRYDLS